ncbi:hypothetical protein [Ruminiclostridium papyrosolvens]|uniref:Uncharacterized protein n=1 Tax=Ruminiclostridium papyrosolvens C7 TaxID=1330534 RepID=U4QWR4_9FIRM|nr:hypothetical protein [Ruminiclostridium papyrosolvens]EPR07779.1 hypothetical protein L323_19975 [Ruminiclostridium papyrosolvens C7]
MAATKTKKPRELTNREKTERAEFKKMLQDKGLIPPDKPKLNRKKFAEEVWKEFKEECSTFEAVLELRQSLGCMVSDKMNKVTEEQVGVLKLMKITVEVTRFKKRLKDEGRSSYTIGELLDIVTPILRL